MRFKIKNGLNRVLYLFKSRTIMIFLCFFFMGSLLNFFKHAFVFYIPFPIPGSQMAATIPPFGIFIEHQFKNRNSLDPCAHPLIHERIHWEQYEKMGLCLFYFRYGSGFIKFGRKHNPMEKEAQVPCDRTSGKNRNRIQNITTKK